MKVYTNNWTVERYLPTLCAVTVVSCEDPDGAAQQDVETGVWVVRVGPFLEGTYLNLWHTAHSTETSEELRPDMLRLLEEWDEAERLVCAIDHKYVHRVRISRMGKLVATGFVCGCVDCALPQDYGSVGKANWDRALAPILQPRTD